mmetsp:Transcript_7401/g.7264  ORF Transcript_7401/g.7264 Transcript_7401/m.7264 type:complete len:264 (+) Transcript_7401:119-910(+)
MDQEAQGLNQFVKLLSKENRDYLSYLLSSTPVTPSRRLPYGEVKNTDMQKHLRHVLLLMAGVISKGDPHNLIIDTAEDLQVARNFSIEDPYDQTNMRKRRRQANTGNKEDLATRLLENLALAYKKNCKKRSEKKRILSISANEITYSEGRRLYGCGPVQFSEAKKHYNKFGPFADIKPKACPDKVVCTTFAKRFVGIDPEIIWKEFCMSHTAVAKRIGRYTFMEALRGSHESHENSWDSVGDMLADLDKEEETKFFDEDIDMH